MHRYHLTSGWNPDIAFVHELDLAFDHLLMILRVLHRLALEIEILGINRLLIEKLIELRAQVLEPVIPLRPGAVIAQGFDVNDAADIGRACPVVLAADDASLVVDDEGPAAEGIDGRILSTSFAGGFVGAYVGMYASSNGHPSANMADFDWFEYIGLDES